MSLSRQWKQFRRNHRKLVAFSFITLFMIVLYLSSDLLHLRRFIGLADDEDYEDDIGPTTPSDEDYEDDEDEDEKVEEEDLDGEEKGKGAANDTGDKPKKNEDSGSSNVVNNPPHHVQAREAVGPLGPVGSKTAVEPRENEGKESEQGADEKDENNDNNKEAAAAALAAAIDGLKQHVTSPPDIAKSVDANDPECDKECKSFRERSWPADQPHAVIYYLIHRPSLKILDKSLKSVDDNFNAKFRYPYVIFIEENLNTDVDRQRIRAMTGSPLYIQVVRFDIPSFLNRTSVPRLAGHGARKRTVGYRHMCRFHAGGVYEQPIMKSPGLQFGWRLDDDSQLRRSIGYDVFAFMRDKGIKYGYHKINEGWSPVDFALWEAVDVYINRTALQPTFYHQWPKNAARYFNNFEISDLSVWRSKAYRDYFSFVDRLGGIYYYKWGDAAIKTIGVTLFIRRENTHLFHDVAYAHI